MRVLRLLAVLASTLGLTACLNSTTIVKVKPDGSGTVEQTTLMNVAALKGMGGASGQANGPMMNKADLEQTAKNEPEPGHQATSISGGAAGFLLAARRHPPTIRPAPATVKAETGSLKKSQPQIAAQMKALYSVTAR